MDFISLPFVILLILAFILIWINNKTLKSSTFYTVILIITSVLFYIWNEPKDLFILVGYVFVNFWGGIWLAKMDHQSAYRKWILVAIIILDLGGLGYYKYSYFLATNFVQIGLPPKYLPGFLASPKLLPLGISFFTFQVMSYCIDVYLYRIQPGGFSEFFLYVIFFPKLSSGPIMRAGDFFIQLKNRVHLSWVIFNESLYLIISGVFLKVVCADSVAVLVDKYWSMGTNEKAHAIDLVVIAFFFSIQIFCSFAGYTNMARGIALLLGFRMPINFIRPYTATSFTQFWRNWHISLTEWIRIYLFYPLERVSRNRIWLYITPILVMAMVGFWHGANWTFIVWGLLFGVGMSFERITGLNRPGVKLWARLGWTLITQLAVFFGWIFFRSSSVNEGWHFIVNIFHGFATPGLLLPTQEVLNTAFPLISYWAGSTDRSLYNLIFPALIDLLPILTILLIHLSSFWENSQQKDETTIVVGIGKAILAGIMLFFCLSVYSAVPSPYLYFKF